MAQRTTKHQPTPPALSPLLRITGRDRSAGEQLQQAAPHLPASVIVQPLLASPANDYTQIDHSLAVSASPQLMTAPTAGVGYAGFTPEQRHHFLTWSLDVEAPAPPAFRQLYLANLEVNLFDEATKAHTAKSTLLELRELPAWQAESALPRALLLAFWLTQDGPGLHRWLATTTLPLPLSGLALGHLSLLHEELSPATVARLAAAWQITRQPPATNLLQMRLASLTTALALEPLAYALHQLGETAYTARPWRCSHRDLRLALPQPDLRPILEPLLREMLDAATLAPTIGQTAAAPTNQRPEEEETTDAPAPQGEWHLILEFGESRSDLFQFALIRAQRLPGYVQMMDEKRRMIHRVHFRKSELQRFWQLWDYVQSWSGTAVYLNGKELQKTEVYPYSPFMR